MIQSLSSVSKDSIVFQDVTFNDSENNIKLDTRGYGNGMIVNESNQKLNESISIEHHVFRETTERDKPVMAGNDKVQDNNEDDNAPSESVIPNDSLASL